MIGSIWQRKKKGNQQTIKHSKSQRNETKAFALNNHCKRNNTGVAFAAAHMRTQISQVFLTKLQFQKLQKPKNLMAGKSETIEYYPPSPFPPLLHTCTHSFESICNSRSLSPNFTVLNVSKDKLVAGTLITFQRRIHFWVMPGR